MASVNCLITNWHSECNTSNLSMLYELTHCLEKNKAQVYTRVGYLLFN